MSGWNLPPGCTDRMVDEAFGYSSEPRGTYRVRVNNTIEAHVWIEVEASSMEDAAHDALIAARAKPMHEWTFDEDDMIVEDVEAPDEGEDPDDARDARADYLYDRDR